MRQVAILGSTGSVGINALSVVRHFPREFRVAGLSANSNIGLLWRQIKEFHPSFVCVGEEAAARELKGRLGCRARLFVGEEGLAAMAAEKPIERILLAISGSAALLPLLKATEAGKTVALANKEALVMAGPLIMDMARKKKAKIIPVDSEQSAIWQCLDGKGTGNLKKVYLTASGGPLRDLRQKEFRSISVSRVLNHPRWKMGKKISVDSATLMNKGLELLEAMFLFGVGCEKIKIVIHPEAVIHSMIEFIDGVVLAQLSITDMRIPIQYALSYPERLAGIAPAIDFYKLKGLHFQAPDFKKFPCLKLALRAAKGLGTLPCVLNAANEVSVGEFLRKRLRFSSIPEVIERVMDRHENRRNPALGDVRYADNWARKEAFRFISQLN